MRCQVVAKIVEDSCCDFSLPSLSPRDPFRFSNSRGERARVRGSGSRRGLFALIQSTIILALLCVLPQLSAAASANQTAAVAPLTQLFPDKVLARGKNFEIKQSQVDELFLAYKSNRASQGQLVPDALRTKIEREILDRLIATRLFVQKATPADQAKAKELGEKFIGEAKKSAASEQAFERQLLATGMTIDMFREQILEQALVKVVIDREIRDRVKISEQEVRKFYDEHPKSFEQPEKVSGRHIFFSTRTPDGIELNDYQKIEKRKVAENVLLRIRAGGDFVKLAEQYSDDPDGKMKQGQFSLIRSPYPRPSIPPEFEGAAFSLSVNQISDVVTTRYGFHIIQCLEKSPARQVDYSAVAGQIRNQLLQEKVEGQVPELVDRWRKEADVRILTEAKTN